jgi:hypothetical protein
VRPYKDGETLQQDEVIILDPDLVMPGDVVLTTEREIGAAVIRVLSGGNFSHAAFCTRRGFLMESNFEQYWSDAGSVRLTNLLSVLVTQRPFVRVLRPKDDIPDRAKIIALATNAAEQKLGNEFWFKGVTHFRLPTRPKNQQDRYFCSHLIASAFEKAGLPLFPGRGPEKISPASLAKADRFLRDVTGEVIKIESGALVELWQGPEIARPQIHELKIYQGLRADKRVKEIIKSHNEPLPKTYGELVEILDRTLDKELDKIMAKGIEQVEKIYKDHMLAHGWVDQDVKSLRVYLASGALNNEEINGYLNLSRALSKNFEEFIAEKNRDAQEYHRDSGKWLRAKRPSMSRFYAVSFGLAIWMRDAVKHQRQILQKSIRVLERELAARRPARGH